MNFKIIFSSVCLIVALFSFSASASAAQEPKVVNYKLNGKEENVRLNPYIAGNKVKIEINSNNKGLFKEIDI